MTDHFSSSAAAVNNHFSMLRLDSSSSLKRPSPPSSHQPNPKKEKLSPPLFPGFSKITPLPPLPKSGRPTRTRTRNPLLRRCISAIDSTAAAAAASPPSVVSTRPPRPAHHRTASDPAASPAAKSASRTSSSSGDDDSTPNTKRRLKRIKDRFREMTLWFEQVMLEDAEDDGDDVTPVEEEKAAPENQHEDEEEEEEEEEDVQAGLEITPVTKEDCDQKRFEESVSVGKVGECIVIHFSCHCGVPYQFLLAGGNCYYKLM
uniref:swi5-dependent recombination DNA repair protein 1 homolog n=1 Tax=Fragaria vesca subsp. vesca TaxID=101020 RepID=UPI0005CB066F|nr:PREDICTED: swi5-dependent recombination DNA repair protein 1 homolog [Fragaria vesca subsp. vesca]